MDWQSRVAAKRRARDCALQVIANAETVVSSDEAQRLLDGNDDAHHLVRRMAAEDLLAETVTIAYIHRAVTAHQDTNCLSEPMFDDALKRARYLDHYRKETGNVIGPLHGVPMSVKDQFNVKGYDSTLGYVARVSRPADRDAALVAALKTLGAVIITKTTIPQSIMWSETESPLWGTTTYPGRPHLTPGGSSGGEVALLAMSGAVCGWGTDLGGSIRGPSHLCGLFGLKPSNSRFPYAGAANSQEGQSYVPSSVGPISPRLSTLIDVTKAFLDAEPWKLDPNVTPLPWRQDMFQEVQSRPLKIGVILDDGVVKPHPEIELAVQRAADLFRSAGHQVVQWDTSRHMACIKIMDRFYRADGGEDILNAVKAGGEPLLPYVAALVDSAKPMSVYEYWQLNRDKVLAQQAYNDQWNDSCHLHDDGAGSQCVDVIISPVMPHTASTHKSYRWVGYTKIWNFMDYSAMSYHFGHFRRDQGGDGPVDHLATLDARKAYQHDYTPRNEADKWAHRMYDPDLMDGLPIGVQIIGRRLEEEKVLGVAKVLEGLLKSKIDGRQSSAQRS